MESFKAVLAIGGAADAADVAKHLPGGRAARSRDGRTLVLYDGPDEAVRDVTAYFRLRAMSFVRFGLHSGATVGDGETYSGEVVDTAGRLADRATGGRLWMSPAVRDALGATVPAETVDDTAWELRRS